MSSSPVVPGRLGLNGAQPFPSAGTFIEQEIAAARRGEQPMTEDPIGVLPLNGGSDSYVFASDVARRVGRGSITSPQLEAVGIRPIKRKGVPLMIRAADVPKLQAAIRDAQPRPGELTFSQFYSELCHQLGFPPYEHGWSRVAIITKATLLFPSSVRTTKALGIKRDFIDDRMVELMLPYIKAGSPIPFEKYEKSVPAKSPEPLEEKVVAPTSADHAKSLIDFQAFTTKQVMELKNLMLQLVPVTVGLHNQMKTVLADLAEIKELLTTPQVTVTPPSQEGSHDKGGSLNRIIFAKIKNLDWQLQQTLKYIAEHMPVAMIASEFRLPLWKVERDITDIHKTFGTDGLRSGPAKRKALLSLIEPLYNESRGDFSL